MNITFPAGTSKIAEQSSLQSLIPLILSISPESKFLLRNL